MNLIPDRVKAAIKTALAMTLAYSIALSMDWDKPMWTGITIAMVSLSTVGQSLSKGVLRMAGTLLAAIFSLALLSVFPQDRWLFFLVITLFIGFCTYMMAASQRQYFWHVAGFVSLIICMTSVGHGGDAFAVAVTRILETGLGILTYTLVSVLLWPTSSRGQLDASVQKLVGTQHEIFRRYSKLLELQEADDDTRPLRMRVVQELDQFRRALAASRMDSYEVWELRRQWNQFLHQSSEFLETMERWRLSFAAVRDLDLAVLLPNFDDVRDELDDRFVGLSGMLEGQPPQRSPGVVELASHEAATGPLKQFQKAALTVTRNRLQHLETLSTAMYETIADIKGFQGPVERPSESRVSGPWFVFDLDRLAAALRVVVALWLAYIVWIYTEVPGGTTFVVLVGPFGMALATMPRMSVSVMFLPTAIGVLIGTTIYVFVMPQLSGFVDLGLMLFMVTFAICYLFASPKQGLGRALGLTTFVAIAGISNQQSYNALSAFTTALMFPLVYAVLALTAHVPYSTRPEKTYLRLLGQFFDSGEYLMTTLSWGVAKTPTAIDHWRNAFHTRRLLAIPQKLFAWGEIVDTKTLSGTTSMQVRDLTANAQGLAYRMEELLDARTSPQGEWVIREMLTDIRAWRLNVQTVFNDFSRNLGTRPPDVMHSRLMEILAQLEAHIEQALEVHTGTERRDVLSEEEKERFYRLLGAFHGLSETMVEFAVTAKSIDWSYWRESRF